MLLGYDYDRRKVFKERKSIIRDRQAPCPVNIRLVPLSLNLHIYIGIVQQFLSEVEQISAENLCLGSSSERKLNVVGDRQPDTVAGLSHQSVFLPALEDLVPLSEYG